ncbi:hypothetical protein LEP1GSC187_2911 [Leptospira santarosai str. ZUN179]|uniref:Uncharacterized protein n=1 Tax=Leptospira santarosai str. ZUN179 TaxID=1049985 RepID=M6V1Y2_9LEPT|nr:hypothetical protein LEP1GSC039_1491 [Leptospira santarosai str. 2000027870]EMO43523.1 hypothetical protein LEP1GSC187_2911 [Leptospira santarosai str. ZUN179]
MFHLAFNFENDSQYLSMAFRVKGEWCKAASRVEKFRNQSKENGVCL